MPDTGTRWLTHAPPETVEVAGGLRLTRPAAADVEPWVEAVNASLDHLAPWLPWAQTAATTASMSSFQRVVSARWDAFEEFSYLVRAAGDDAVLGGAGLHTRQGPSVLEIGYWVHVAHGGRGIATAVAGALTDAALAIDEVESVWIRCDVANVRSMAVPRHLGYRLVGSERREPETPGEIGELAIWVHDRA